MQIDALIQLLVMRVRWLARENQRHVYEGELREPVRIERRGRVEGYTDSVRILRGSLGHPVAHVITELKIQAGLSQAEAMTLTGQPSQLTHTGRETAFLTVVTMIREAVDA